MKKLFPEAPDVTPSVANRAAKIIEKHMRLHRVEKAQDLPEEAKVRLYRDLRFLFEADPSKPSDAGGKGRSIRAFFSRLWGKIDDFLSAAEATRSAGTTTMFSWVCFGDTARLTALPWGTGPPAQSESI